MGQEPQELAATTQTTHYRYDALGRRIDKSGEFGATRFGWDGDLLSLEIRGSKQSEYLYESSLIYSMSAKRRQRR